MPNSWKRRIGDGISPEIDSAPEPTVAAWNVIVRGSILGTRLDVTEQL
jgi:hypothetical protein